MVNFLFYVRHGWVDAMGAIRPPHMKVICPTAKTMPVTLNSGFAMPSWFDLKSLEISGDEDTDGIKTAASNVHALIQSEMQSGIPSNRIILGGFSQGGALALYAGMTFAGKRQRNSCSRTYSMVWAYEFCLLFSRTTSWYYGSIVLVTTR